MNIQTFRDAVSSKRAALVDDDQDDYDDDEKEAVPLRKNIEGEEEDGAEKFNEMGIPIEPFNMKDERDGGFIDENMNYVFQKEKGEMDAWIANLDEAAVEAAIGEAAEAEKKIARKRELEELEEERKPKKSVLELKEELLTYMQPTENISTALRRLSGKSNDANKIPGRRRATSHDFTEKKLTPKEIMEISKKNRPTMDRITEIADELISNGLSGIYGMTYEAIYASTVMWEYKGLDGNIYGPYTSQQLADWKNQGYFTGDSAVQVRKVKSVLQKKPTFSMYDDDEEEDSKPPAKKSKIESSTQSDENEWTSSDAIDFGSFINLDDVNFEK